MTINEIASIPAVCEDGQGVASKAEKS